MAMMDEEINMYADPEKGHYRSLRRLLDSDERKGSHGYFGWSGPMDWKVELRKKPGKLQRRTLDGRIPQDVDDLGEPSSKIRRIKIEE